MNRSRWFWLGIPALLALAAAIAFVASGFLPISPSPSAMHTTGSKDEMPVQSRASENANIQQMINSGQFAPPPGNPEKKRAIAKPLSNATQPKQIEFETPPGVGSNKGGQ